MNEREVFLGKNVKVFLKNKFCYTGKVMDMNDLQVMILDKYGKLIGLSRSDISVIQSMEAS